MIGVVALIASMISLHSPYWFLPLIFAGVSLVGFYLGRFFILDTGMLLSIISYLFVNRGLTLNIPNILVIIGPFFLLASVWFSARNKMMIIRMKNVIKRNSNERLISFRKSSLVVIFNNLFLGAFLAILGSIIGMYSSLEIGLSSNIQMILMVVFSSLVFFIIYLNIDFLTSVGAEE